ncbi:hypothetical protein HYC85_006351 [Camellia sinensis]|uniref:Mediator complex subunit 23 n=1 Tax=Camellia sinensis TaxID=4442 RepID=A0A7J7HLQ8_CAMSI|nr:hypothetical protein HYC85_006351 [Camellia sinensis]
MFCNHDFKISPLPREERRICVEIVVVPNIAMVETYVRLLLLAPHSMFRSHLKKTDSLWSLNLYIVLQLFLSPSVPDYNPSRNIIKIISRLRALHSWHLSQRNAAILNKPGPSLLVLEILNYRLLSLYGYQGKSKNLMYDITKIISTLKGKRGDHRIFRLAENLCMNLIFSLREFFVVKKEGKGPTEFTETLNCITITTLAIIIKTRGIAKADQMLYLPNMLEQILSISQHTWSEKTLRYFPSILRDALNGRMDTRGLAIQKWQQGNGCGALLGSQSVYGERWWLVTTEGGGGHVVELRWGSGGPSKAVRVVFGSILFDVASVVGARLLIVFLKLVEFYAFDDGRIDVLKSETTVIKQCTQLLSPSADPTYAMTYISHSFQCTEVIFVLVLLGKNDVIPHK